MENRRTVLTLKMKKVVELGSKKRGKNLAGHELGKDLLKGGVGRNIFSGEEYVIV